MFNFVKKETTKKSKKGKNKIYFNLAPTGDAQDIKSYRDALDYALDEKNEEIRNIAVVGKYGSGKSSVIKTFFNKDDNNKKYNPIYLSVSFFSSNGNINKDGEEDKDKDNLMLNNQQSEKKKLQNEIEKNILQQLFYQEKKKKLPLSRFNRIEKHNKFKLSFFTIDILIVLIFILNIKFNFFSYFEFKNNGDIILNGKNFLINLNNIATIVSMFVIFYVVIYNFLFFITYKFAIKNFKLKDAEISVENNNTESTFDKYLDEIIYFFQCSKHKVVIIEDLDRYGKKAIPVFNELREINSIINNAKQIGYNVKFIYAIKDAYFDDSEERTKFFDFIIPILPVVSYGNSNEIIWDKLQKIKDSIRFDFDKKFINDISTLIENDRIINNVINEFIIFKEKLIIDSMDDKKIFAMIVYKNLFPSEYAKLQNNKGRIYNFFKNKDNLIKMLTRDLEDNEEKIKKDIEEIKNEILLNEEELKSLLVFYIDKDNIKDYCKFVVTNKQNNKREEEIRVSDFLTTEINKDYFTDDYDITYESTRYGYINLIKNENDLFKKFGGKRNFLRRLERIENKTSKKEKELNNIINEINDINKLSIERLISLFGETKTLQSIVKDKENKAENLNDIEKFLIKRGYIAEDYEDYITVFYEGDLKKEDYKFILSVKNNKPLTYDFKITNITNIIERFVDVDYENYAILNYNFVNYIAENNNKKLEDKIINLIDSNNVDTINFIDGYIANEKYSDKFVKDLIINSYNLWHKILTKSAEKEYINKWVVRFLYAGISIENVIGSNVDYINNMEGVNNSFTNSVNNSEDIDKYIDNKYLNDVIDTMKKLKIKLSNITEVNNSVFINKVLENNLYKLNSKMIKLFLNMEMIDIKDFKNKNLTIILNENKFINKYVFEDFNEYYINCYSQEDSSEDPEESINIILHNNDIDNEIKKGIIKNEKFNKYSVEGLDLDLVNEIILEDKMDINYSNILYITRESENLSEIVANHIRKHINEYKNLKLGKNKEKFDDKILNDFIHKYIYSEYVSKDDLAILIKSFKYKIAKIEEINLDKLDVLINSNSIAFNIDNYEYIKKNYLKKLSNFIINNKSKFINNIKEYDFSSISDELLQNDIFNRTEKMKIALQVDLINLSTGTLVKLIQEDVIKENDEEINLKILGDTSISSNEKIYLLKKFLKELDKDVEHGTKYIHSLLGKFTWINSYRKSVTLDKDKIDEEFCKLLKKNGYIREYKIKPTGRITLYNYKK